MEIGTVIAAIGDPTRRSILESVRRGPRSVSDIAQDFQVSRSAVSQHLRVLADAKLVRQHRSGRNNFYTLDLAGLSVLRNYVEGFWTDVLAAFQTAAILESLNKKKGPVN